MCTGPGDDLYRYKGLLSVAERDERFVFQARPSLHLTPPSLPTRPPRPAGRPVRLRGLGPRAVHPTRAYRGYIQHRHRERRLIWRFATKCAQRPSGACIFVLLVLV